MAGAAEAFTFFVDAASGTLVHVRNEVYHADIQGHLEGMATLESLPDVTFFPSGPVQNQYGPLRLPDLEVFAETSSMFTDAAGEYFFPGIGEVGVIVEGDLVGHWVEVVDATDRGIVVNAWTSTENSAPCPGQRGRAAAGLFDFSAMQTSASPEGPPGLVRYGITLDDQIDPGRLADSDGPLCTFTAGAPGELALELWLSWVDETAATTYESSAEDSLAASD